MVCGMSMLLNKIGSTRERLGGTGVGHHGGVGRRGQGRLVAQCAVGWLLMQFSARRVGGGRNTKKNKNKL